MGLSASAEGLSGIDRVSAKAMGASEGPIHSGLCLLPATVFAENPMSTLETLQLSEALNPASDADNLFDTLWRNEIARGRFPEQGLDAAAEQSTVRHELHCQLGLSRSDLFLTDFLATVHRWRGNSPRDESRLIAMTDYDELPLQWVIELRNGARATRSISHWSSLNPERLFFGIESVKERYQRYLTAFGLEDSVELQREIASIELVLRAAGMPRYSSAFGFGYR
jgi:hypothetical protein